MLNGCRYLALTAIRTRAPLLALAATSFAVFGIFYYPRSEVGSTWGLLGVLGAAMTAWLVVAVLTAEPPEQADIATAALGGLGARSRVAATFACLVAAGVGSLFVVYPLLLDVLRSEPVFDRSVAAADVAAALATTGLGAGVGGAVGVLCSPPRIVRRANSAAAMLAVLLGLVAVAGPLGDLGGPVATADAIDRAPPGQITAAEAAGWVSSTLLIGMLLLASRAIDSRRA